jgi:transposase
MIHVHDLKSLNGNSDNLELLIWISQVSSHKAKYTKLCAKKCCITLVYLPKYSPDLNSIEYIWKSIKRVISRNFIRDIYHMRTLIRESFLENASKLSFAKYWIERFLGGDVWCKKLGS